ncbi:MAG: T9SS type A sorting domain-containing protein, partial [Flavobacteriales bacterium]
GKVTATAAMLAALTWDSSLGMPVHEGMPLVVYPNPVDAAFGLDGLGAEQVRWNIYDATGQLKGSGTSRASESIDASHLPTGIYILRIESSSAPQAVRFLKQ